jgi:hypothetical protein
MHHTFTWGRGRNEPRCGVRGGEAKGSRARRRVGAEVPGVERRGGGGQRRVAAAEEEEASVEAAVEETSVDGGVEWRHRECGTDRQ